MTYEKVKEILDETNIKAVNELKILEYILELEEQIDMLQEELEQKENYNEYLLEEIDEYEE